MDDILIYTSMIKEHWELIRRVLQILKENKLFLKLKKCEFEKEQVNYLGVVISTKGVSVDLKNVEAIKTWPKPKRLLEVQEFIGFLNFYRWFIEGFSKIVRPLHNLMKKGAEFLWTDKCQKALDELKKWITSASILAMAQDEGLMKIEADACQYAFGGILSQEQRWRIKTYHLLL